MDIDLSEEFGRIIVLMSMLYAVPYDSVEKVVEAGAKVLRDHGFQVIYNNVVPRVFGIKRGNGIDFMALLEIGPVTRGKVKQGLLKKRRVIIIDGFTFNYVAKFPEGYHWLLAVARDPTRTSINDYISFGIPPEYFSKGLHAFFKKFDIACTYSPRAHVTIRHLENGSIYFKVWKDDSVGELLVCRKIIEKAIATK